MTTENVQTSANPDPGESAPAAGPLTAAQASAQLEQLRTDRLAGKVLEDDYLSRADYLARVAAGEQLAAPDTPPATLEERFAHQFGEAMRPPAELHEYDLGAIAGAEGEAYSAAHNSIATALQAGGVPAMYGRAIVDQMNQMINELGEAPPSDVSARLKGVWSQLQASWGKDFDARKQRIDEIVLAMAAADRRVGDLVDSRPWVIYGSPLAIELLDRVAQHKVRPR